jgi:hypothetical protein
VGSHILLEIRKFCVDDVVHWLPHFRCLQGKLLVASDTSPTHTVADEFLCEETQAGAVRIFSLQDVKRVSGDEVP